jgi:uncharacterized membrane protein YdjX (TVP38/TMEM64 family)
MAINLKHLLPLLLLLVGLGAVWAFGLAQHLSWPMLARHEAELRQLVADHPVAAPLLYGGLYALVVAFSLPEAAVVTVLGGLLFGTWLGGALAVLGSTLGAVILFLAVRYALLEVMERRFGKLLGRIRPRLERDGFSYLLAIRLVPVFPFWLVNLAAALCGMRVAPFLAATLIGVIPATLVFASIGASISSVLAAGGEPDLSAIFSLRVLGPLVALAALSLLPVVWRRVRGSDG